MLCKYVCSHIHLPKNYISAYQQYFFSIFHLFQLAFISTMNKWSNRMVYEQSEWQDVFDMMAEDSSVFRLLANRDGLIKLCICEFYTISLLFTLRYGWPSKMPLFTFYVICNLGIRDLV